MQFLFSDIIFIEVLSFSLVLIYHYISYCFYLLHLCRSWLMIIACVQQTFPWPTSCYSEKVLPGGAVNLDVALSNVMLVLAQSEITVFLAFEPDERFAVASTLLTETQCHAAPETIRTTHVSGVVIFVDDSLLRGYRRWRWHFETTGDFANKADAWYKGTGKLITGPQVKLVQKQVTVKLWLVSLELIILQAWTS